MTRPARFGDCASQATLCGGIFVCSSRVKQHGEKMEYGAGKHEKVPDEVGIGDFFVKHEKHHAQGVRQASGEQQNQTSGGHVKPEWSNGDQNHPAHGEVEGSGQARETGSPYDLENEAGKGQGPDQAKQRPTPSAVQYAQCERRVRSGDEEVDGDMINDLQQVFAALVGQGVVERGDEVEQDGAAAENGVAHDQGWGAVFSRVDDQDGECGDSQGQAQAVAQTVGDLFAEGLRTQRCLRDLLLCHAANHRFKDLTLLRLHVLARSLHGGVCGFAAKTEIDSMADQFAPSQAVASDLASSVKCSTCGATAK